jgi:hypothetical protein
LIYEFCKEEYGVNLPEEWEKYQKDNTYELSPIAQNMKFFHILSERAKGIIIIQKNNTKVSNLLLQGG